METRSKRRHGSGGDEDGSKSSRQDKRRVPDGDNGDDDDDMGIDEDDHMYAYDYSDDDAGRDLDLEEEETNADDSPAAAAAASNGNKGYTVLTEDRILERQQAAAADVAEVLSIPLSFAVLLLRHFKWRTTRVKDEWFDDDQRVRDAVGLPPPDAVPMALSRRRLPCGVCFGRFSAGEMRSAGCSHFYCDACWRGYIHAAVGDGTRCLSLRCPDPACSAAVAQDLVDAVAGADDKSRYARFALRSFVEDSGSVKWCPSPGCTFAVELAAGGGADARDVFCDCRHGFCWSCGEEAHRPVSCDTVRAWMAKNVSDAETANWVLTNTKHCPMCRQPIEKNQGCNHMTCRAPCRHQFCWLCLDPWKNHSNCSRYYDYDNQPPRELHSDKSAAGKAARKEEAQRRQAKASLDRYLYHYQRWASNRTSLHKALDDMDQLRRSGLDKMAAALEIDVKDLDFLTKAYELIADGRRLMRWVYAYGYYLDPVRDKAKRALFDLLQDDANNMLEKLHSSAELERRKFTSNQEESADAMNEKYRTYKKQLKDLTGVTRNYFGNLVKAFETDLPEFNAVEN